MRISTKGRFAVNALIDLAQRQGRGPVALATIAARQQVSLSYLEQLFARLRREGIVESTRGPGGGYTLGRDATEITVADVVLAVEDAADAADAAADGLSAPLWQRLNAGLVEQMGTITLQGAVDEAGGAQAAPADAGPRRNAAALRPAPRLRLLPPNSVFAFGRSFAR